MVPQAPVIQPGGDEAGLVARARRFARRPALASLLDQAVVSGFGFVSGIATARLVGIEEFGLFVLILIVTAFAQGLHNALVTAPMMTLAARGRRSAPTYDATVLAAALLASVVAAAGVALALVVIFALRHHAVETGVVVAGAALTVAQNLQLTVRRTLFARGRGLVAVAMDTARAAAFPLALAVAWWSGRVLDAALATALLAGTALVTAAPLAYGIWRAPRRPLRLVPVARRHWGIARWMFPLVFVTFGQEQMAWIVAGIALGDEAIGGLRAAQYLVGFVIILLTATENILPTAAAQAFETGGDRGLRAYLENATLTLGPVVALLLLAIALPAGTWLALVFGPAFADYAASVRILALAVACIFLRDMVTQYFRAIQDTGPVFRAFVVSLAVSLAIMVPLIAWYGITGAALVITIGHAVSAAHLILTMRRRSARGG
ncbi:lipopolysaccharide biosynthesis protein [Methylobacterium sp. M6A4_1b]